MRVLGRTLLVILMVIGVLLVAAGTASIVGADSWTSQIDWTGPIDDINIVPGVFKETGDGGVALGVVLLAASIITNLSPTDFVDGWIGLSD